MRWTLIFALSVFVCADTLVAESHYQWHLMTPISIISHPNVLKQRTNDFGSGLGVSILAASQNWLFGPGFGVYGTWPLRPGNTSVGVSPYRLMGELKWSLLYEFSHKSLSFMPFISGDVRMGSTIINRRAGPTSSRSVHLNYAFRPSLGASVWIHNWGLGASYAFRFGEHISHQADLFLSMRIISL